MFSKLNNSRSSSCSDRPTATLLHVIKKRH